MKTRLTLLTALSVCITGFPLSSAAAPGTRYVVSSATPIRLPVLLGGFGQAFDVNESGIIVGISLGHAVKWNGGDITDLDPFSSASGAYAINESGSIVGYRRSSATSINRPARFGPTFISHLILPPTVQGCVWEGEARGINDNGVIVGSGRVNSSSTCAGQGVGLYWTQYTTVPIQVYGSTVEARLFDVNNAGKAVGMAIDINDYYQAVSWQAGVLRSMPAFTDTPDPFLYNGSAEAINEAGNSTGVMHMPGSTQYGAMWFVDTSYATNLGHFSPGQVTVGNDINDQRFVVGKALIRLDPSSSRAFLWHGDFGLYELPVPAGHASCVANGVTNLQGSRLLVVGSCWDSKGPRPMKWDVQVRAVSTSAAPITAP